jgi:hypothetical protein
MLAVVLCQLVVAQSQNKVPSFCNVLVNISKRFGVSLSRQLVGVDLMSIS